MHRPWLGYFQYYAHNAMQSLPCSRYLRLSDLPIDMPVLAFSLQGQCNMQTIHSECVAIWFGLVMLSVLVSNLACGDGVYVHSNPFVYSTTAVSCSNSGSLFVMTHDSFNAVIIQ